MSSTDFLKEHTVPFELDGHGTPGVKMRSTEEGTCHFVTDEGCTIYEDRPTSCRYYPAGVMSMKAFGAESDDMKFFQIKEDHCKGHDEDCEVSIDEYRNEQGVKEYDENNLEYYHMILKKKSSGPTIDTPPEMSMQLFFMTNYDMDRFRRFVESDSFANTYDLDTDQIEKLKSDDYALMHFGYDLLKQVLFGDKSIKERDGAYKKRIEERGEIIKMHQQAEREHLMIYDPRYKPDEKVKDKDLQ